MLFRLEAASEVIPKGGLTAPFSWLIFLSAMPQYSLFIWNQKSRVKYPRSFELPDLDAARSVALKVANVFAEVVPYWNRLSAEQRSGFVVEIVDEAGQMVLTVPFREAEESKP